jgi:hypothetical protein
MTTKHTHSAILLVAVVAVVAWIGPAVRPATVAAPVAASAVGSITVSGSSAIRVPPNRVVILLGVEAFRSTPSAAHAAGRQSSQAVVNAVRDQGVARTDVATADFSIQPRYSNYGQNTITGSLARNTVAVTLRDVQQLEGVLVAALEAGTTTIDGVEFSVTNLRDLRDRARDQAVRAAMEKAAAMATSAGRSVGEVTDITEHATQHYFGSWSASRQWTNYQNVVQELAGEGGLVLEDGTLSLGQIVVQAEVNLTAELVGG